MKKFHVYILVSKRNGMLCIGVTSNLEKRVWEHKQKVIKGFTKKYNVNTLVYYEEAHDVRKALKRKKQLKHWNRAWKIELIAKENPEWSDLSIEWYGAQILSQAEDDK